MSDKSYTYVATIIAVVLVFILGGVAYEISQDSSYKLVTQDGITITIEGHCETQYSPVFVDDDFGFVKCNGEYYYDIKEFREIK